MPDVVEHEFNGFLIPPGNAAAMEEGIVRLAGSVEFRQKLGEAARETMKRYTWERAARKLEAFYRHVLSLEGHRRA
jgi:glycosyltransferase involved in cell wall biosynthesis